MIHPPAPPEANTTLPSRPSRKGAPTTAARPASHRPPRLRRWRAILSNSQPLARPVAMLVCVLGLLAVAVWGIVSLARGLELRAFEQHLADSSTADLTTSLVAQSFRSPRANLNRIDLLLSGLSDLPSDGRVRLLAGDGFEGSPLYDAPLSEASFQNPYLVIAFPPIAASEGATYTLVLETRGRPLNTAFGLSYNGRDALSSGALYTDEGVQLGDLAFATRYRYDVWTLWGDVVGALGQGSLILSWVLLLLLPGLALLAWLPNSLSGGQRLLAAPGLTALTLPVFFLVTRALGVQVGTVVMWVLLAICSLALMVWWARHRPRIRMREIAWADVAFWGLLLCAFLVTLITRLLSLRDASAGMGLDAYHHTLIAEMFVQSGGIPSGYEPYAPLTSFTYHYGFHALVATVGWLSGQMGATDMMLLMPQAGQVASALPVLTLTLFGWKALGNRWAGLAAGAMVGLGSLFPAFYVNWSRYTQGLGLALLPVAWVLLLEVVDRLPASSGATPGKITWQSARQQSGPYMLAVLSAAGLALTHYRIAMAYAGFVAVYFVWRAVANFREREPLRETLALLRRLMVVGVLTLAALLPWLVNLAQNFTRQFVGRDTETSSLYYSLERTLDRPLLTHPSLGLLFALASIGMALLGWSLFANRRLGLALGIAAGLVNMALYLYIRGERLGFDPPGVAPVMILYALLLLALALLSRRKESLMLLPAVAWVVLGIWSNPYLLPVRLPYAGYLDATTLVTGMWLPLALPGGYALAQVGGWLLRAGDAYQGVRSRVWRVAASAVMTGALIFGGAATSVAYSAMLDSKPYISRADAEALVWIRDNLPRDSYVLANPFAFGWAPRSVHGSDSGLWVPLVARGVRSSVPPLPAYNERPRNPDYLNDLLNLVFMAPIPSNPGPDWDGLKAAGITHIYVGSRGGALNVRQLLASDRTQLVFHKDSVWIFELR